MEPVTLLLGAAVGWLLARVGIASFRSGTPDAVTSAPPPADATPAATPTPPVAADARARVSELAKGLNEFCEQADQVGDLEQEPRFLELSALLATDAFTAQDRINWMTSPTTALSCAAIAAMTAAGDDSRADVARATGRLGYFAMHFAFKYVAEATDPAVCGAVLLRASGWWSEYPVMRADVLAMLDRQRELGVTPTLPDADGGDWDLEHRSELLRQFAHPLIDGFLIELERADRARRGQREVARVGRLLALEDEAPVAQIEFTRERIDMLVDSLQGRSRPSLVLVGADGVGKTTLARAALREMMKQGWRVVEATPSQMMAGQKYLGELEQRVQNFVDGLGGERVIWFVTDCHQLLEKGTWSGSQHGLLDLLLPYIERGALQLLGESTVAAWTRVISQRPRVESLITGLRVEPLGDADALALARDWGAQWQTRLQREVLSDAVTMEACELARQHFPERAEPGRTLALLKETLAAAQRAQPPSLPLDREQLLAALARSSGLPLEILDIGRPLDVTAVREFFSSRVIGQDEAVDCLVDRISMLKAGLTDPHRPIGVFLFAGPTGTGKTEIAKTLARYLFGSPDRMLRFDMSEYQSEDSYWRLIDEGAQGSASLVTRVRQNPFSVILLDEFEKANPRIWDLFLQVFDDGRLTDRSGNTADFRHCIIVLTSNLGSTIARGAGAGFVAQRSAFSRDLVDRAIDNTFRREFINRLDRVVVFNPLTRAMMRDILEKELRSVLERRGFRSRDWAVEWEPSAVEFLLDRGFTPDLGARPLRRAIDQHLLAPLARTIVEHRVPSGEQFLFVQGEGDALRVRFVDPDEPAIAPAAATAAAPSDLRALALDPRADNATLAILQREIQACAQQIAASAWRALKDDAARAMQQADFWQRPERQRVLDRLERMDRIEAGLQAAESLHARLIRAAGRGVGDLVRRLALLVVTLDAAIGAIMDDEAEDASLEIKPADPRSAANLAWRDRMIGMYRQWGDARGMRVQQRDPDPLSGAVRLEVSGFAAFQLLRHEQGMHVLESHVGDSDVRHSVRVFVSPDPAPAATATPAETETRICRRYDDGPAPLVRDNVRGWRSGRLDRVLAGDFDLMGGE